MKKCTDPKCKKDHYVKPAMSSVAKYIEHADGTVEELPKPEYQVKNPKIIGGDWPIDYWNYRIVKSKTN